MRIYFYKIFKECDIMKFNSKDRTEMLKVRVSEEEKTFNKSKSRNVWIQILVKLYKRFCNL